MWNIIAELDTRTRRSKAVEEVRGHVVVDVAPFSSSFLLRSTNKSAYSLRSFRGVHKGLSRMKQVTNNVGNLPPEKKTPLGAFE